MQAHKFVVVVPASGRVEIALPKDFPARRVEIIALPVEEAGDTVDAPRPGGLSAYRTASEAIDQMQFPRRTKEEIDAYLAQERASWGDEP